MIASILFVWLKIVQQLSREAEKAALVKKENVKEELEEARLK